VSFIEQDELKWKEFLPTKLDRVGVAVIGNRQRTLRAVGMRSQGFSGDGNCFYQVEATQPGFLSHRPVLLEMALLLNKSNKFDQ